MLKQRIFTALILIPLFVTLVLSLPPKYFSILTGIIVFWCACEWSSLMGLASFPKNIVYPFVIIVLLALLLHLMSIHVISVVGVLNAALAWWLIAGVLVVCYPKVSRWWGSGIIVRGIMGVMVLIPCWVALNFIRLFENGDYIVLLLFVLIWGADTGAYFSGKLWGKNKLMPAVSPGKTWQGLAGALVVSVLLVMATLVSLDLPKIYWSGLLLLSLVTVLFSVLGDLFESMLKRQVGIKDSGVLLPGHGGILDRIDSLTAAAPIFALGAITFSSRFHS